MTDTYPKELASILSCPRLTKYREEAKKFSHKTKGEEIEIALRFYTWNTALSAAFYGPLQALEIALRNAVNEQMKASFGETWYSNTSKIKLNNISVKQIDHAITELQREWGDARRIKSNRKRKIYTIDNIIAELSFGFWTGLFIRDYQETLWKPVLHKAFPHEILSRGKVYKRLKPLNIFRNRIAHHEPIFRRPNLETDMANILDILGWICPITRDWVKDHERLSEVIKMRPPNDTNLRF